MRNNPFLRNLLEGEITHLVRAHTALRRAARTEEDVDRIEYERRAKVYLRSAQESHERRIHEQRRQTDEGK